MPSWRGVPMAAPAAVAQCILTRTVEYEVELVSSACAGLTFPANFHRPVTRGLLIFARDILLLHSSLSFLPGPGRATAFGPLLFHRPEETGRVLLYLCDLVAEGGLQPGQFLRRQGAVSEFKLRDSRLADSGAAPNPALADTKRAPTCRKLLVCHLGLPPSQVLFTI